jgi:hypothetical protein
MTEDKDIIRVADCHAENTNTQIALFRWRNSRPVEYSLYSGLVEPLCLLGRPDEERQSDMKLQILTSDLS